MRKSLVMALCTIAACAFTITPRALAEPKSDTKADAKAEGKVVTISGEGKCAKCSLKEADKCQNVIQAKEDGKTVTYWLAKNEVSDKFHKNVCTSTKKVTAKGTVKEVNGKKELTATEIKTTE